MAHRAVARTLAPLRPPGPRRRGRGRAAREALGIHALRVGGYVSAAKGGKTAQVEGELNALAATLAKDAALSGFVKNPTIPRAEDAAVESF